MRNKGINREYKDRLFKFIFGNPNNREWTLSLYNAVNGSDYTDANMIEFNTIEDAVYMSMKNDVSFIVNDTINLYEQQSSFNPNMPMRFLVYGGMIYSKFVENDEHYNQYSPKQQKAPAPRCICFYNGTDTKEDRVVLKLSDSFNSESDFEVTVTTINVNYGHNKDLLDACRPLKDYARFVDEVRTNQKILGSLEKAVEVAIDNLPEDSVIRPFLLANKAEVKAMCITEYDEQKYFALQREEGRTEGKAEGRAEGKAEGRAEVLAELVKKGLISEEQAKQMQL